MAVSEQFPFVEYDDLAHLCDRVIVFRDGVQVSELSKPNLSEEIIVEHCFRTGQTRGEPRPRVGEG